MAEYYSIVCVYHILFIHSSIGEHLVCLYFLAIMNNAVGKFHVQIFVWTFPLSEIAGSGIPKGYIMILMFNILKNCQTVFQSCCTIVHSHQQYMQAEISPPSCQHMLLPVFFIIAI